MAMLSSARMVGSLSLFDTQKKTATPMRDTVLKHLRNSRLWKQSDHAEIRSDEQTSPLPERALLGEAMCSCLSSPTGSQVSTFSWWSNESPTVENVRCHALEVEVTRLKAENAHYNEYLLWLENMIGSMEDMNEAKSDEITRLQLHEEKILLYYQDAVQRLQELNDKMVDESKEMEQEMQNTNIALQESLQEKHGMQVLLGEKTVALKDVTERFEALQKDSEQKLNSFVDDMLANCKKRSNFTCIKCSKQEEGKKDEQGYIKYCGNPNKYVCDECHNKLKKTAS